jgi:GNAT superfamily N-acetyltransferase
LSREANHRTNANDSVITMHQITLCGAEDRAEICAIINESASAYQGVIPVDRWHEPYMPDAELRTEIEKGVRFHGYRDGNRLLGVMGIQDVKDVTLIRHAYVRTECRGQGIGRELLAHLRQLTDRPVLIGTWRAASWAILFYQKNGFTLLSDDEKNRLLKIYWTVPERQIEESVVLADARWTGRR